MKSLLNLLRRFGWLWAIVPLAAAAQLPYPLNIGNSPNNEDGDPPRDIYQCIYSNLLLLEFQTPVSNYVNVKMFGAVGDGQIANLCNMQAGSTTLTNPNPVFSPTIVGDFISVYGASNGLLNLTTTVTNWNSAYSINVGLPAAVNVTNKTAVHGAHDDSAAIQTAIDVAGYGGGTVFSPAGIYLIADTLQDIGPRNAHQNAQLSLPAIAPAGLIAPTINLEGPEMPGDADGALSKARNHVADYMNSPGAVWWSLLPYGPEGTNYGSVLACQNFTSPDAIVNDITPGIPFSVNFLGVSVHNMIFRSCWNANLAVLNLGAAETMDLENVIVDTGYSELLPSGTTLGYIPTNGVGTNGFGIICPVVFNGDKSRMNQVRVEEYFNGVELGENLMGNALEVFCCAVGLNTWNCGSGLIDLQGLNLQEDQIDFYCPGGNAPHVVMTAHVYNYTMTNNIAFAVDPYQELNLSGSVEFYCPAGFLSGNDPLRIDSPQIKNLTWHNNNSVSSPAIVTQPRFQSALAVAGAGVNTNSVDANSVKRWELFVPRYGDSTETAVSLMAALLGYTAYDSSHIYLDLGMGDNGHYSATKVRFSVAPNDSTIPTTYFDVEGNSLNALTANATIGTPPAGLGGIPTIYFTNLACCSTNVAPANTATVAWLSITNAATGKAYALPLSAWP
jgi:hypothetical protein